MKGGGGVLGQYRLGPLCTVYLRSNWLVMDCHVVWMWLCVFSKMCTFTMVHFYYGFLSCKLSGVD